MFKSLEHAYQTAGEHALDSQGQPPLLSTAERELKQLIRFASDQLRQHVSNAMTPQRSTGSESLAQFLQNLSPQKKEMLIATFIGLFVAAMELLLNGGAQKLTHWILTEVHIFLKMESRQSPLLDAPRDWPTINDPGANVSVGGHVDACVRRRVRPFFVDTHNGVLAKCPGFINQAIREFLSKEAGPAHVQQEQRFDFFNQSGAASQRGLLENFEHHALSQVQHEMKQVEYEVADEFAKVVWEITHPMAARSLKDGMAAVENELVNELNRHGFRFLQ